MEPITSQRHSQYTVESSRFSLSHLSETFGSVDPPSIETVTDFITQPAEIVAVPSPARRLCGPPNQERRDRYLKCARFIKKMLGKMFSHVGLISLFIGYTMLGGFLFRFLEGKTEIVERETISKKRNATVTKIWLKTADLNILEQGNWSREVEQIMKRFQNDVVEAIKERGWDGRDEFNKDISWSFFGSVLYSVTVLTTIGYGHIAPKTHWGRMTTMLYALLGIPLTLLCLSTIGDTWAKCFRFLYKYVSLTLARVCTCRGPKSELPRKTIFREALNTKGVTVPLWVSLLIIGGYIGGGAVLFSTWEREWDYLVAAYFCFITLSTIGFGDFVFGFGSDINDNIKLIASAMYLFMGLAIMAMCFNLMQEEVRMRFKRIGLRMGLIKPKQKKRRIPQLVKPQLSQPRSPVSQPVSRLSQPVSQFSSRPVSQLSQPSSELSQLEPTVPT